MTTTYTPSKGYALQGTGDNVDTWGTVANNNFSLIDKNMGGVFRDNTTPGGNLFISSTDAENNFFQFYGTLTSDLTLVFPDRQGQWTIMNLTVGGFSIYFRTVSSVNAAVQIPSNATGIVMFDGAGVYASNNNPSSGFTTGDVKVSYYGPSQVGWVWVNGTTIGPAGSAATQLASNTTLALYTFLWNAGSTVVGGRGVSASADWLALKPIYVPDWRGRVLGILDNLGGTSPAGFLPGGTGIGGTVGSPTVTLTPGQMPYHNHTADCAINGDHVHTYFLPQTGGGAGAQAGNNVGNVPSNTGVAGAHNHIITVGYAGNNEAHSNVQATVALIAYMKL